MISVIVTIALLILTIIVVYFFLKKLAGANKQVEEEESEMRTERQTSRSSRENTRSENVSHIHSNNNSSSIRIESNQTVNNTRTVTHVPSESRNLTKKEQMKMEKKKAKEEAREYQRMVLEEKKQRELEKERIQMERDMKREEEKRKEEEALRKLKEEQEKKENEIFDQWKNQFVVAEEGEEVGDLDNEDLINDFINYIKLRKVVSLEDLSGVFKINPNDIVDRLNMLESQGRMTGIIDDRGKYIYLTEKELAAIEKVFMQRGRISKVELIKECNKIIRFAPTEEDKVKIMEEQNKVWKTFEAEMEKGNSANANAK